MADADYVKKLLADRAHYEEKGWTEDVAGIDAELKRVGHTAKAPAKRAQTRKANSK